ncbi:MAG: hypothetical protein U9N43_07085 [Euryarchaeota archaeon]|nr:hypothetical protein [Euryarchaeota archaeon]
MKCYASDTAYRYSKIQYKIIGGTPMVIQLELSDVVEFERAVLQFVAAGQ